jgi:hypothetical protein
MVYQPWAGVEGDVNFMFLDEGGQCGRIHGIDLMHQKAAFFGTLVEDVREGSINVSKDDPLKTIPTVELQSDNGTHATDAEDQCVCHINIVPVEAGADF